MQNNQMIIGKKIGMTRIFDDTGVDYPVTIIEAGPCNVTQIKAEKSDGYDAVQIGFGDKKENSTDNASKGHFAKSTSSPKKELKEYRISANTSVKAGDTLTVDLFSIGDIVSVSGVSKGKGFAGHMKRHGFHGGSRTHGKNSVMRKAGSVGASASPSRIWPGTRMAGRMGNDRVTVKNLTIIQVDNKKNLLFVKGAVPGANNGIVYITK